jgi:hypothetical protein
MDDREFTDWLYRIKACPDEGTSSRFLRALARSGKHFHTPLTVCRRKPLVPANRVEAIRWAFDVEVEGMVDFLRQVTRWQKKIETPGDRLWIRTKVTTRVFGEEGEDGVWTRYEKHKVRRPSLWFPVVTRGEVEKLRQEENKGERDPEFGYVIKSHGRGLFHAADGFDFS